METKQNKPTLLQRIVEQENEQIRIVIEQAIDDGAEIVDGIFCKKIITVVFRYTEF